MKEYDLKKLLEEEEFLQQKIDSFFKEKILKKQPVEKEEILGHVFKAERNFQFVTSNTEMGFLDWAIAGCYYASYHAAVALIMTKGYSSKNHLATLCILIKEFYEKGLSQEEIIALSQLLDYQDILFYVESKNKREDATYSTKTRFEKSTVEQLNLKAHLFFSKIKNLLKRTLNNYLNSVKVLKDNFASVY